MLAAAACERFKAKVMPHFDPSTIELIPVHVGERDRIVVGYTYFTDDAMAFLRFVVGEVGGGSTIAAPFVQCLATGLSFAAIVAEDEGQALDKLADWFIANKDAIKKPRPRCQVY